MARLIRLRNLFLYAGLERETFHDLRPVIHKENLVLLRLLLAAVMFFLLLITSMLSRGFASVNSSTYLTCGIAMLVIQLCARYYLPKQPAFVMVYVYLFEITLYVFGIHISMLHAEMPAVSAIAFLLVTPLLFYDRPITLSALIALVAAVFCGIVTFGIVAIATSLFIMNIKMRALAQSRQIEYMGQTDLLTGVKNRNHYEKRLQRYPEMCTSSLVCVYADVNGLHEMNNREGHSAGDRMLREVASKMQQCFGREHTYRIGGDEFAAFRVDGQAEEVSAEIDRIRQELAREKYHVSFGISVQEQKEGKLNMAELIKEAEDKMFAAKKEFYRQPEHNRRNR